jgi:Dolichyl-phosphate-mannose-protein mannosyltransferase
MSTACPAQLTDRDPARDRRLRLLRTSVVLGAAGVRVVGSTFGFPHLLHPDEFAVVDAVAVMAEHHSFEPPWSYRPDHVEMKLDYGVFAAFASLKGTTIQAVFARDQVPFYYLARLVTGMFGVATVVLAYLVGARWSRGTGLVAAALFAVFPPFVLHAHYATPDVPLTFAVMLLVYALVRYAASASWWSLLAACFAVALAIGIKYPGAVGAVMIAVMVTATAIRDRRWRRFVLHAAASMVATTAFLFAISPTLFLHLDETREQLRTQSAGDRLGHADRGYLGNLFFYVTQFLQPAGVVVGLLAVTGLVVVVRSRRLDLLPWFSGVPILLSLSALPMTWDRWGLPMWVTPLLLAAVGTTALLDRVAGTRLRWVAAVALGLAALHLTAGAVAADAALVSEDTRLQSLAWADAHGVTADETAYEGYTPFLPGGYLLLTERAQDDGDGFRFLTKAGRPARYVVVSDFMYGRVLADPAHHQRDAAVYRYVFDHFPEIASFTGRDDDGSAVEPLGIVRHAETLAAYAGGARTGPTIRVFAVPGA